MIGKFIKETAPKALDGFGPVKVSEVSLVGDMKEQKARVDNKKAILLKAIGERLSERAIFGTTY